MLLHDEALTGATKHWIRERHYNAEWALSAQLEVLARQFDEMEDEYLRERKADLEQVVERLLRALARGPATALAPAPATRGPRDFARRGPAGAGRQRHRAGRHAAVQAQRVHRLRHRRRRQTSHTAIVARSMDIPAVVGAREASRLIRQDDWVVIDGDAGVVIVDPSPIVLEEYRLPAAPERARARRGWRGCATRRRSRSTASASSCWPTSSCRTTRAAALEAGAVGVGLFRSEFLFMNRGGDLPGEDEQFEAYRAAVEAMKGLPVTIRTVDVGADKPLDRMSAQRAAPRARAEPGAGAARDPLEPVRAGDVPPAAARHPARQRATARCSLLIPMVAHLSEVAADARRAGARAAAARRRAARPTATSRSAR